MKKYFFMFILTLCLLILTGCSISRAKADSKPVDSYFRNNYKVEEPLELILKSFGGNVEVFVWNSDEVFIEISGKAHTGDKTLKDNLIKNIRIKESVDLHNLSFDISYQGARKDISLCSADVKLYIPRVIVSFNIVLNNGKLKLIDDFKGTLLADIGDVDVQINNYFGKIKIEGNSGNINILNGRLDTESVIIQKRGNIKIRADLEECGDYNFATSFGNIELFFPYNESIEMRSLGNVKLNEFTLSPNPSIVNIRSTIGSISVKKY